jgi:hypothetical protein
LVDCEGKHHSTDADCTSRIPVGAKCPDFYCSTNPTPTFPGCDFHDDDEFDGRDCVAQFKKYYNPDNEPLEAGQTWGAWAEALLDYAKFNVSSKICAEAHPSSGFQWDHRCGLGAFFAGSGEPWQEVGDNVVHPANFVHSLKSVSRETLIYGYDIATQAQKSFAPTVSIASAMITHEQFINRVRDLGYKPMHVMSDGGEFPCLPKATIERAIEYHGMATHHAHSVGDYIVNGMRYQRHDIHKHFIDFVPEYSSRFTNNTSGIRTGVTADDRFFRGFGLAFSDDPDNDNQWRDPLPWPDPLPSQRGSQPHLSRFAGGCCW